MGMNCIHSTDNIFLENSRVYYYFFPPFSPRKRTLVKNIIGSCRVITTTPLITTTLASVLYIEIMEIINSNFVQTVSGS